MQGGRKPDPDHLIVIAPMERVVVKLNDAILAESSGALVPIEASLNPVYRISRADVALDR